MLQGDLQKLPSNASFFLPLLPSSWLESRSRFKLQNREHAECTCLNFGVSIVSTPFASDAAIPNPGGTTASERYLAGLGRNSFLSVWSYANVFTDEGRRNGKGDGKELADLLVVFGNHVLIFSDKHCEFATEGDLQLNWARWYRKAIRKSIRQLYGARSWLMRFPDRVFMDAACSQRFPVPLPPAGDAIFHLIAVTRGAHDVCRSFFGNNSLGSLIVDTRIVGDQHLERPFTIGRDDPTKPFVHVLDELTLDVLMQELDTATDLVAYLGRKETLLSHPKRAVMAAGEEQLVAIYLTKLNNAGEHDFVGIIDETAGMVMVSEGYWEKFVESAEYKAKKQADRESYAWDALIENFARVGFVGLGAEQRRDFTQLEVGLRQLASESRLSRRQLGSQLLGALNKPLKPDQRFVRVAASTMHPDTTYVFLILPIPSFASTYEQYRNARRALLLAVCKVSRLYNKTKRIIGIAAEPRGTTGGSEDLLVFEPEAWGDEEQAEARQLQSDLDILRDHRVRQERTRSQEYPVRPTGNAVARLIETSRLARLEKLRMRTRKG